MWWPLFWHLSTMTANGPLQWDGSISILRLSRLNTVHFQDTAVILISLFWTIIQMLPIKATHKDQPCLDISAESLVTYRSFVVCLTSPATSSNQLVSPNYSRFSFRSIAWLKLRNVRFTVRFRQKVIMKVRFTSLSWGPLLVSHFCLKSSLILFSHPKDGRETWTRKQPAASAQRGNKNALSFRPFIQKK